MQALDLKVKKALKWDAQGLKMWKLHMNNKKFKEIAADDEAIKQDVKKFITSHPKINNELGALSKEIEADFQDVGQRLKKTGDMLGSPKYKAELEAIGAKW
jgi:DNA anti-recombination protein RmuC